MSKKILEKKAVSYADSYKTLHHYNHPSDITYSFGAFLKDNDKEVKETVTKSKIKLHDLETDLHNLYNEELNAPIVPVPSLELYNYTKLANSYGKIKKELPKISSNLNKFTFNSFLNDFGGEIATLSSKIGMRTDDIRSQLNLAYNSGLDS